MPGLSSVATLPGNDKKSFGGFGFNAAMAAVSNPGSTWVWFPQVNGWVAPFTFGALVALGIGRTTPILVRSDQAPPGFNLDTSNLQTITVYFVEDYLGASPGFQAPGTGATRWNVNAAPATGSQASVAKAASPGVIHVGDAFAGTMVQGGTTTSGVAFKVLDGAATQFTLTYAVEAVTGHTIQVGPFGPGMGIRGTSGNSMTVQFTAGVANVAETVNLNGYDQ